MEPSLSGISVITQQPVAVHMADTVSAAAAAQQQQQQDVPAAAAAGGRPAAPGQQQQQQMQTQGAAAAVPAGPEAAATGSPGKGQDAAGLQRLTAALTAVLSSGMASDFVEGLKPVLHNGKLAISTYIKLQQDPEPVFIGMFSSLPAAVAAQKQSAELVGQLPAEVARKLIAQQLAHTDPSAGPGQQCQGGVGVPPERWQSNTTSESTALGAGSSSQAGDATPNGIKQEQSQHESAAAKAGAAAVSPSGQPALQGAADPKQQQDSQVQAQTALQSALAAAAAVGAQGGAGPTPGAIAAAVAAASPRQPVADDVIRMLLHKGLHALTVAQQQHPGEAGGLSEQQEQSLLEAFTTPASTPGSGTGLAGVLQQLPSPQQLTQQQRQALVQQLGAGTSPMDRRALLSALQNSQPGAAGGASAAAAAAASAAGALPSSSLPPVLPLSAGQGAAAGLLDGDLGLALDGALNDAMLRGMGPWGGAAGAAGLSAGMQVPFSQAQAAAAFSAGAEQMGLAGFQQQQQQQAMLVGGMAGFTNAAGGNFSLSNFAGFNAMQQQGSFDMQQQSLGGLQGMGLAGGAAYGADFDSAGGAAATAAAVAAAAAAAAAAAGGSGEGAGAGDKRKRAQNDPRVNCVKSVQYRVSRFPAELHDVCIQHWERARCARVVCNEVQGVMSVQNGRCVVTFNQSDQEVVKGVADYLRYAGEERIKKWRRHVRMVDFPRPGNRTGELMTAEEFLCIVGYQSEAGGGKRPRTDLD